MYNDIVQENPELDFSDVVRFNFITSKSFNKLEELHMNYLYFLVDTGEIYKGGLCFSNSVVMCNRFPDSASCNKIYYNTTTKEVKYYDVKNDTWISLMNPMVESLFDETIDYGKVTVTGKAIKEYVEFKIDELYKDLGRTAGKNTTPIFNTYEAADKYAKSDASIPGQCITAPCQTDEEEMVMYVVQKDKSLKEYPSMAQVQKLLEWKSE